MKYRTDNGGFAASCDDLKIFFNSSTWATKLSQLGKSAEKLIIMTKGFAVKSFAIGPGKYFTESIEDDNSYIRSILDKRPNNIFILCNSSSISDAKVIKKLYPQIRIKHYKNINANIALFGPRTVMFSSESFGYSSNDNYGVGLHSREIYEKMLEQFRTVWRKAEEV